MTDDYWKQSAKLVRLAGGMALAPDPPIWSEPSQVADGNLSDMLRKWADLPPSHQPHHGIEINGDILTEPAIRGWIDQPRD
ncbi:hypothetical protein SPAN111604_05570 [Sphingomonas antarctica]|uniref:hypothetical protein n=1 Tax=Sphingomonas antarctica TaxID=2040274 RepID=UPI0039E73386